MNECKFDIAWIGKCKKPARKNFCDYHLNYKCKGCKKQATHECPTASSLVCGVKLCDDCKCPCCGY